MKLEQEGFDLEIDDKEVKFEDGYVKPHSDMTYRARGFNNTISKVYKHKIKDAIDRNDYHRADILIIDYIKKLKPLIVKTKAESNAKAFFILRNEFLNMLEIFGYHVTCGDSNCNETCKWKNMLSDI